MEFSSRQNHGSGDDWIAKEDQTTSWAAYNNKDDSVTTLRADGTIPVQLKGMLPRFSDTETHKFSRATQLAQTLIICLRHHACSPKRSNLACLTCHKAIDGVFQKAVCSQDLFSQTDPPCRWRECHCYFCPHQGVSCSQVCCHWSDRHAELRRCSPGLPASAWTLHQWQGRPQRQHDIQYLRQGPLPLTAEISH